MNRTPHDHMAKVMSRNSIVMFLCRELGQPVVTKKAVNNYSGPNSLWNYLWTIDQSWACFFLVYRRSTR